MEIVGRDAPIEGILIKPADYDPSRKYPLMVVIHGGPDGRGHSSAERGPILSSGDIRGEGRFDPEAELPRVRPDMERNFARSMCETWASAIMRM